MTVQLNHTIVWCKDQARSSRFVSDLLGLRPPTKFASFDVVELDNGVSLDFIETDGDIAHQHYAFLISEDEFDEIFARIVDNAQPFWADPGQNLEGEINRHDGGRGIYFADPDGHLLEVITRPYSTGQA